MRQFLNRVPTVVFIFFILLVPVPAVSDYELVPFKLKELPPQKEVKDPLETMRVVSSLKAPPERQIVSQIAIRSGFPIIFGHIGGKTAFKLPYFGFTYKQNFGNSKIVFWEAELGYFAYRSKDKFIDSIKEHALPITLSLVWDIPISSGFYLYPKIGVGYMVFYSQTNIPNMKSGFGGAILLKPSLAFGYEIAKDWMVVLDGTLLMAQDVKDKFGNFDYYLIPSLGLSHRF